MYKTVRHGENSLQYTILPQTEEVITKSGMKGRGRDFSPSIQVRRKKEKSTCVYCLLFIFGCLVTIAVAAVPIYIVSKALSGNGPIIRQSLNLDRSIKDYIFRLENPAKGQSKKKELKYHGVDSIPVTAIKTTTDMATSTSEQIPLKPAWVMPAFKRLLKTSTQIPSTQEPTVEDPVERHLPPFDKSMDVYKYQMITDKPLKHLDSIIKPTAVLITTTSYKIMKSINKPSTPKMTTKFEEPLSFHDVLITSGIHHENVETSTAQQKKQFHMDKFEDLKNSILSLDDDDDFKGNVELEEGTPDMTNAIDDVQVAHVKPKGRWPFVDPSSYFQWTGYTAGDNLLLPTILAAALSALCFVVAVVSLAYRRRNVTRRNQSIGKLTSDLQPDDNTNLLTPEEDE